MLSPRLARPPSIWNDDVAVPQTKPSGKRRRAPPAAPRRVRRRSHRRRPARGHDVLEHCRSPMSCRMFTQLLDSRRSVTLRWTRFHCKWWHDPTGRARKRLGRQHPVDGVRPRAVTLDEVARRSGVSRATASRALNGRDRVEPRGARPGPDDRRRPGLPPERRRPLTGLRPGRRARPRHPHRAPRSVAVRGTAARGGGRCRHRERARRDAVARPVRPRPGVPRRLPRRPRRRRGDLRGRLEHVELGRGPLRRSPPLRARRQPPDPS